MHPCQLAARNRRWCDTKLATEAGGLGRKSTGGTPDDVGRFWPNGHRLATRQYPAPIPGSQRRAVEIGGQIADVVYGRRETLATSGYGHNVAAKDVS